jgi:hypothetical protein
MDRQHVLGLHFHGPIAGREVTHISEGSGTEGECQDWPSDGLGRQGELARPRCWGLQRHHAAGSFCSASNR